MIEKDRPEVQKQRISETVAEVLNGCEAVFDPNSFKHFVRFRIDHKLTGNIVSGPVSEHASVFADYSDESLRKFIATLAPYHVKN
jgi:hypothetical protein